MNDPLARPATPARLHTLVAAGVILEAALPRAMTLAHRSPSLAAWYSFLQRVLLALGGGLILAGVVYLVAFNWEKLGPVHRLVLLQLVIVGLASAAYHWREAPAGKFSLLAAAVLVGPLLAVYGQTYQTGADPWELFLGWTVLILPWVLLAKSQTLWLLSFVLITIGAHLFADQVFDSEVARHWIVVASTLISGGAWWLVERLQVDRPWLEGRWLPRIFAAVALATPMPVTLEAIFDGFDAGAATAAASLLAMAVPLIALSRYRGARLDLFVLAASLLAIGTLFTTGLGRVLLKDRHDHVGALFLIALIVMGQVMAMAWWLRRQTTAAEAEVSS